MVNGYTYWLERGDMTLVSADNLPWYLIGALVSAQLAVFYALLGGKIVSSRIAEMLRESAEKRAEIAEAGMAANTKSLESLGESVGKLMVLAENQDKILKALRQHADRGDNRGRGGPS